MLSIVYKKTILLCVFFLTCIFLQSKTEDIQSFNTGKKSYIDAIMQVTNDTVWVRTNNGKSTPIWDFTEIDENVLEMIKNQVFDSIVVIDGKLISTVTFIPSGELMLPFNRSIPELSWQNIINVMNFEYKPVDGLVLNEQFDLCKPYSIALHNTIRTNDGDFIAWCEHYFSAIDPIFTDDNLPIDSVVSAYNSYYGDLMNLYAGAINNYLTRITRTKRNTHYINIIRDHLIDIAKKHNKNDRESITIDDLNKDIDYLPEKNGQMPYNADIVIKYPLPVKPVNGDKSFPKKYSHCEVLLLQKTDIGPIVFYCFFTNKGYKQREVYYAKLEKAFSFKQ